MSQVWRHNRDIFSIFFNMKVYCVFEICSKGRKNEFETSVVNEPSVFEPLKFYCIQFLTVQDLKESLKVI